MILRFLGVVQFGLRAAAAMREIPSLRLKNGSAQDDSRRVRVKLNHYRFSL
jgi:hypothetical protein